MTSTSSEDVDPLPERELDLRGISTQWSQIHDSNIFILRYAEAARRYLVRLLGREDDAEEVLQTFLVRMLENGFQRAAPDKGRFRFYLIRAIKNEAIDFQRKQSRRKWKSIRLSENDVPATELTFDEEWNRGWTNVLLERAWDFLKSHQKANPGNYSYAVLKASTEHPEKTSASLAAELSESIGQSLSAEAYRKQLSRARRVFAETILREVADTIESAEPTSVLDELTDLGLLVYVRDFLPKEFIADVDDSSKSKRQP